MISSIYIILVLVMATTSVTASGSSCQRSGSRITVNTVRNASGHWQTTLRLDQNGSPGGTTHRMNLDIEPVTSRCDGERVDSLVVQIQGPSVVPSTGYQYLPGFSYYKIHKESVSWEEAKILCENEDAHLLILNSQAEAFAVLQLVKSHPDLTSWLHIGFNDKVREGHYVTIFGETLAEAGYSRWNEKQPDNAGNNEHCGSAHALSMNLNDLPCKTWKTQFICEQDV